MASQVSCIVRPQKAAHHILCTTDTQPPLSTQWSQSHKSDPNKTSFLDLPLELRDQIYTFALHVAGAIFSYSAPSPLTRFTTTRPDTNGTSTYTPIHKARIIRHLNTGPHEPRPLSQAISLPLLRTCRQLHAECTRILYSTNTFRIGPCTTLALCPAYARLVKHVILIADADPRLYSANMEEMGYAWKRHFWPSVLRGGEEVLRMYENLTSVTVVLSGGEGWRPAFIVGGKGSRGQRRERAVWWLKERCKCEGERLRGVLRVEISEAYGIGEGFICESAEEEWDVREFAEAFREVMERG